MTEPHLPPSDESPKPRPLSADDAAQLAGRVAELAAAGLPLASGLRAAAAELPGGRLADALENLAAGLDRGQTLDQALTTEQGRLPVHLRGLIAAGVRTGRLGKVLEQFVSFRQFVSDLRRSVWLALAYPLVLVAITAGLFVFLVVVLTPLLKVVYEELRAEPVYSFYQTADQRPRTPENLRLLEWLSGHGSVMLSAVVLVVALLAALYASRRSSRGRWFLNRLPVFGCLWRFSGLAEFARLLSLLVEHAVPLPEALRLTADGISDADLARGSRCVAERIEAGETLSAALSGSPQFAALERCSLAWGDRHAALGPALEATGEMSVQRLGVWSEFLRGTVPAVLFLIIASGVLLVVSFFQALMSFVLSMLSYAPAGPSGAGIQVDQLGGALSLALIGIALLLALRLLYSAGSASGDALQLLLQVFARVLLAFAALGCFVIAARGLGVILWFGALAVWGMIVFRRRRAQQRMLTDLLALAMRRGLPAQEVVEAFAAEQPGAIGRRAAECAERLRAGYPLAEAIRSTRRLLPHQALLALEVGQQVDSLPAALDHLPGSGAAIERLEAGLGVGLIGPLAVCIWGAVAVLFFAHNIVPAYEKIFLDFHRPLPPLTQRLFHFLGTVAQPWLLLEIIIAISAVVFGLYLPLYKMGWIRWELPLFNRLFAPRHAAVVLRWLAETVRRGRPLQPTLALLGERYPERLTRSRLRMAALEVLSGADWIASLRGRRLIRGTEAAILRAASRAGNLAWALDEAAAAAQRRLAYRLQWIGQVLLPLPILFLGGCVMLFAVGCMLPLIDLISGLAKQ